MHGTAAEDVHFHEVGALDAIADVVGVCAGLRRTSGSSELVVSPVAVGSGRGPRRARRDAGAAAGRRSSCCAACRRTVRAGADAGELCTPTGAALLAADATGCGAAAGR